MASNIDVTLPVARHPSTVTERANWQAAHDEITALQEGIAGIGTPEGITEALGYVPYDATNPAHYQTDQQVAAELEALLGMNVPLMDGPAAIGVSERYAREDHVHPSDTSLYPASNPSGFQNSTQVTTALTGYAVPLTQRGVAGGVATLDGTARVPASQLPNTSGSLNYRGGWNASSNSPALSSGALVGGVLAPKGDYFVVTVGATITAIDGVTVVAAGDWMLSNGVTWERVQATATPYLPLAGGQLTGPVSVMGAVTYGAADLRNPNIALGFADASGAISTIVAPDGTWRFPSMFAAAATITSLTLTTAPTFPALTVTGAATLGSVATAALSATGGDSTLDIFRIKGALVEFTDPRNPTVGLGFADAVGALSALMSPDGSWQFGKARIVNATLDNLVFTQPLTVPGTVIGNATTVPSDSRNRYTEAFTDGTDQGSVMITQTGALAANLASGYITKHLQSRVERSHIITQGPISHSESANVAGVANTTHHLCCTLDTVGFEAIRLVIPSMGLTAGGVLTACVAVSANPANKLNPVDASGNPVAWKPVTFISAGADVAWEDQPYGSIQLTTTNVYTPQGSTTLIFTSSPIVAGVTPGMVCYIPTNGTASGIYLADHWARVVSVTDTQVTLSKPIQNGWNMGGTGNHGLPVSWPVFFSPEKLTVPAWPGNGSGSQVKLLVSDWVSISSLSRSDNGRWPVLMVRIYGANAGYTTLVTTLSQTDWNGYARDRVWKCYTQTGDFVSNGTQSGFTNTTDNGTMALGWVQFYSRTRGATIMFSGDSITQGINAGSINGLGCVQLTALQLSTPSVPLTAVGMVNGWNGCGLGQGIWASSIDHVDIFKPQILAQCTWSRNGEFNVPPAGAPPYSQPSADWYFQQTLRIAHKAMRRYRTQVLYFPMGPSDAVEMSAATEQVRLTGTVRARQANQSGEMLIDQDLFLGTGSTPVNDTYYQGLHPPSIAQMILSLDIARQLKHALGL